MKVLLVLTSLSFLSTALADDPRLVVVTSSDYKKHNVPKDRRGPGTRGGGDYRLKDAIDQQTRFLRERERLIAALGSIDWASHEDAEVRKLFIETLLPADPVSQLESLEIQIGEPCFSPEGKVGALLASDAPWVCVDPLLSGKGYRSIWGQIAQAALGLPAKAMSNLNGVEPRLDMNFHLDRVFHLSVPEAHLPSGVRCITYQGPQRIPLDPQGGEVRRHPKKIWTVRVNSTYGICE